jgi:hypothetical protein
MTKPAKEKEAVHRGRPASGRGVKLGLYLAQARLQKLGPNPAQAIYAMIDSANPVQDCVRVSLTLTSEQLAAIGASSESTARDVLMKTVKAMAAAKQKAK